MKFKLNNKYFRWGLTAFSVIAAAIMFYYFVFHSSSIKAEAGIFMKILMPVVFGLVTAYLLTPILNFLEEKILFPLCDACKIKDTPKRRKTVRGIGIFISAFLFLAMIYGLISMLVSQIVPSIQGIVVNFDTYSNNVIKWINKTLEDNPEFRGYVTGAIDKFSAEFEKWLTELLPGTATLIKTISLSFLSVVDVIWDFVIGFIISIYVLAGKERFVSQAKKIAYACFERNTANTIVRNFRFTHKTFIGFLIGKVIDSIIIGLLCFIGTTILRTPYALLISVIIGATNIIPFFGPFLGAVPSILLIFVVDPMHPLNCVYFAIFIFALQQFDGNILGPKILGSSTGLTGFWVIFAITLFGGLYGVPGMIVGVPIFAVFYAAVKSVINTMLAKKSLPQGTDAYDNLDYIGEDGFHIIAAEPKRRSRSGVAPGETERTSGRQDGK